MFSKYSNILRAFKNLGVKRISAFSKRVDLNSKLPAKDHEEDPDEDVKLTLSNSKLELIDEALKSRNRVKTLTSENKVLKLSIATLVSNDLNQTETILKLTSELELFKVRAFYVALRKAVFACVVPEMFRNSAKVSKTQGRVDSLSPTYDEVLVAMLEQIVDGVLTGYLTSIGIEDAKEFHMHCHVALTTGREANRKVHEYDKPLEDSIKTRDYTIVTNLASSLTNKVYRQQCLIIVGFLKVFYPPKRTSS